MANNNYTTVPDLIGLLHRVRAALKEEGSLAHRADELAVVIREDGSIRISPVPPVSAVTPHPAMLKALEIDPKFEKGSWQ